METITNNEITLGNLSKRIVAGIIDYGIILLVTILMIFAFGSPSPGEVGKFELRGWPAFLPSLFWFLMTVAVEQLFGATVGNALMNLKPIDSQGYNRKPDLFQSIKRHLLDPLDMFPFGIIGIITISNTQQKQRVGDLWAKTIVVEHLKK